MLSCNEEGTERSGRYFLGLKVIFLEGEEVPSALTFIFYKEIYMLLRRKDHFFMDILFLLLLLVKDLKLLT